MKFKLLLLTVMANGLISFATPTDDLFSGISNGDMAAVKLAIASGADVNALDGKGNMPLITAGFYPEIVAELIAAKADLNKANGTGAFTPLTFACYFNIMQTVKLLVEAGADVNLKTGTGTAPVHAAVMSSCLDIVKYIIEKGGDPKATFGFNQNLMMVYAGNGKSPNDKVEFFRNIEEATAKAGNKIPDLMKENQNPEIYAPVNEMLDYLISLGFGVNDETDVLMPAHMPGAEAFNKTSIKGKVKQSPMTLAFNLGYANADVLGGLLSKGGIVKQKTFSIYFKTARLPTVRIPEADLLLVGVKSGNIEVIQTLVKNSKINPNSASLPRL